MTRLSPSIPNDALNRQLAIDPTRLQDLKAKAKTDPQAAARETASQFEALLVSTLLKSMRATRFDGSESDNAMDTYQGMADQQMVQALGANGGLGLGDMIYQQIAKQSNLPVDPTKLHGLQHGQGPQLSLRPLPIKALQAYQQAAQTAAAAPASGGVAPVAGSNKEFIQTLLPHAREAARQLGVAPEMVVAHAALESGWGRRAIRNADGSNSHNLFGIKATGDWQGKTASVMTTEYEGGVAQKRVEKFRAYGSYAEAFSDYAQMLKNSPRYKSVMNQGQNMYGFAQGLQSGGYATDPRYARKLVDVAASLAQQVVRT
ncbi:flagellar assembly peptidoglycan hydrolase FlgJ [Xenophilus sp. AP218F]|nr:flagellar assembly peptidoglycan hydrolase FlgJ [Xenophilus sp. AP218F]